MWPDPIFQKAPILSKYLYLARKRSCNTSHGNPHQIFYSQMNFWQRVLLDIKEGTVAVTCCGGVESVLEHMPSLLPWRFWNFLLKRRNMYCKGFVSCTKQDWNNLSPVKTSESQNEAVRVKERIIVIEKGSPPLPCKF